MDQIISNFVPYNNPYIILSWTLPEALVPNGFTTPQEIRSEVLWDGNISLTYPTDIQASEKYKVVADTTFIIKGWLFPAVRNDVGNIYYINNNFHNVSMVTSVAELTAQSYTFPLSSGLTSTMETVSISGQPQVSNVFYTTSQANTPDYIWAS